jgi:ABC-type sugar transport system substrate-binding protein
MPTNNDSPTAGELKDEAPVETNFPEPVAEGETAGEAAVEEEPKPGEVWAIYQGQQPSQRILRVQDLQELGDKNATEPLVWDRNNRYRREVSDVHPMVLEYIEETDGNFKVVRPS